MEKIKYRTKFPTSFNEEQDFFSTILEGYGVKDIDSFLSPSFKDCYDAMLFNNIIEGIELLHSVLTKENQKISIKVDPDVDGFTSSAFLVRFIHEIAPDVKINWRLNYEKRHGLFPEDLKGAEDSDLLIIPDASYENSQLPMIRKITKAPILVLDHHIITYEPDNNIVIINNQDGSYPNSTLSGAGVVYKFCKTYCKFYNIQTDICDDMLDLVATGLIADSMDLRNLETRYLVFQGLEEIKSNFLKELYERCKEDMAYGFTILNVGWVIAPRINAACRYGKPEEQKMIFRAMCEEQEEIEYQPRRKKASDPLPPLELHTLQWEAARVANNIKNRQDEEVRRFMEKLDKKIKENNLDKNSILFINSSDIVDKKTVTGLVCNKLANKYARPCIVMRDFDDATYGGSGRNYAQGSIENLNQWLKQFGVSCEGHEEAFGIKIQKSELADIIKKCNKALPLTDLSTIYDVDYAVEAENLTKRDIEKVALNYKVWGNTIPEPVFYIHNIKINSQQIHSGGTFVRFVYKGIPFIKKYCSTGTYEQMICKEREGFGVAKKDLVLDVIGVFNIEEYEGQHIPHVKIRYFDSNEDTEVKTSIIDDDFIF